MRMNSHMPDYEEAMAVLWGLSPQIERACFHVELTCVSGVWEVDLVGYQSHSMAGLIRTLGFRQDTVTAYPETGTLHVEYVGHRGRIKVTLVEVEKVIRRVDGVTGQVAPVEGLW